MIRYAVTLAAVLLAGCETQPRQQYSAAADPTIPCLTALEVDARFQALWPKMPPRLDAMSIEHLAIADRATEEEKRQLSILAVARQTCIGYGEELRRARLHPAWRAWFDRRNGMYFDALADLYAGKITFGDFNRRRREYTEMMARESREMEAQSQAQAAQAQRDAATNYLLLRSLQQTQPPAYQLPRSLTPPTVNCTTRYIGQTAYTSCQ